MKKLQNNVFATFALCCLVIAGLFFALPPEGKAQALSVFYEYINTNNLTVSRSIVAAGSFKTAVSPQNANYTIVPATDRGKRFTNTGAAAATQFNIPTCAAANVGDSYGFAVDANKTESLVFNANDVINLPTVAQTTKTVVASPITPGAEITIGCYAVGKWGALNAQNGNWTSN